MAGPQSVIASLLIKLGMDPSGVAQGAKQTQGIMGGLQKHANLAVAGAGAAVGDFIAQSSQKWVEFDDQMRQVMTILPGISEQAFGKMKGDVRDLAKEFGVTTDQVIPGLYDALSSGVPQDNIVEFMRVAQKGAVAGVASTQDSVNLLAQLMNAYHLNVGDMAATSDMLFQAVNKGVTTIPELASSMSAVTPIAASMGIGIDEVLATITAMTLQGSSTAESVTMMRSSLVALLKPLPALQKGLEDAGYASGQAAIDALGYQGAMELVRDISERTGITLPKLTGRIEGTSAVLQLTGENADKARQSLDDINNSAGLTDKAFRIMSGGIGGTVRRLQAALGDLSLTVGQALEPLAPIFMAFGPQIGRWIGRGIGASAALGIKAIVPAMTKLMPAVVSQLTELGVQAGGGMGKGLMASMSATFKSAGWKKLLAGAGLALGGQMVQGMGSAMGGIGGAATAGAGAAMTIAGAFMVGGPVLAGIAAVTLALQELMRFMETVGQAQADLTGKVAKVSEQTGQEALANLEKHTAALREVQGFARVIGDTFAGGQEVEALVAQTNAIIHAKTLPVSELDRAITAGNNAVLESEARGNQKVADQIKTNVEVLGQMRMDAVASADGLWHELVDVTEEGGADAAAAETAAGAEMAGAVTKATITTRERISNMAGAISGAWGDVTNALAKGPEVMSFSKRMATIRRAIEQNVRGLRRAVKAGDVVAAAEYNDRIGAARKARADILGNAEEVMKRSGQILGRQAARSKHIHRGMTRDVERESRKAARIAERQAKRQAAAVPEKVTEAIPEVDAAVAATVAAVETPLTAAATAATTWGSHLGSNFAAGITGQYGAALRAADSLAGAVRSRIAFSSPPRHGPLAGIRQWGPHMVMEWVRPIDKHIRDVEKRGDALGRAVTPKWKREARHHGWGPSDGAEGHGGGAGRAVGRMRVAHMSVRDLDVHGRGRGGDVHYHIGTLIASESGIDELDKRTLRRRRMKRRGRDRDPGTY